MDEKKVEVDLRLINAIVGYLGKKPFEEVFEFINELQKQVHPQLADSAKKEG
jgi:hypothetical protein